MYASKIVALAATSLLLLSFPDQSFASNTFSAADAQEVRALFLQQAAGETAHDPAAIDAVLARAAPGKPDPVTFIARAYRFWGRDAVIDHFRTTFAATWKFEPDLDAIRIVPLGIDVAHIYAPTKITIGAAGQPGTAYQFLVKPVCDPDTRWMAHFNNRPGADSIRGSRCHEVPQHVGSANI